jgi:hypothetical protein
MHRMLIVDDAKQRICRSMRAMPTQLPQCEEPPGIAAGGLSKPQRLLEESVLRHDRRATESVVRADLADPTES